ncbi:unnamed protein product [Lupinus luteus]|uniref:AB hydrolase-1 domain-containing protein n=1 Tax=Lupinus luteus TaxID=3873 RepID=A0AAV1XGS2_LUPLU
MATLQSDSSLSIFHKHSSSTTHSFPRAAACRILFPPPRSHLRLRAFSTGAADKPSVCTADELHYVSVNNSDWRVALWRYHPCPQAPPRNHPLLLLSGMGTNAIGYDLSPGSSFARYMSGQGFETWILEVRGAGLSLRGPDSKVQLQKVEAASESAASVQASNSNGIEQSAHARPVKMEAPLEIATHGAVASKKELNNISGALAESEHVAVKGDLTGSACESQSKVISTKLLDQISGLLMGSPLYEQYNDISRKLSTLLETRQNSSITSQITELSQRLVNSIEESQLCITPPLFDLQTRFSSTIGNFQKQLDSMVKYDWDFDHHLEEDVPAVIEYIMKESKPKDGKLLAIGHSMGGILLYSMLSRFGFEEKDPRLAAVVTLASSLDYTSSKSTLKLLMPLADPAQALNVPVVPLGALLAAAHPLSSRPPYVLSWLNSFISAEGMMDPDLLKRLVLNGFGTVPAKLILQLTTAFQEGGLCNRDGTFFYKDHIHKINVPTLAIAGDQDLICPPEAVEDTIKLIPEHLVTYKVFGKPGGPNYAHYDLVGGRMVYPCIVDFLTRHDK